MGCWNLCRSLSPIRPPRNAIPQGAVAQHIQPRLLTVRQAAKYLGCSEASVYHQIKAGKLVVVRRDRRVFLDVPDLDRIIEACKRSVGLTTMAFMAKRPNGTGSLFRRGRFWLIKYYQNGISSQESSKSEHQQEAKNLLARRLGDISTGKFQGLAPERITIDEICQLVTDATSTCANAARATWNGVARRTLPR